MGNPPEAKRAGLPVDLDRLAEEESDAWMSDDERLALKMNYGICTQGQPDVFMVRIRTAGGILDAATVRGLAELADEHGNTWLHLTNRQQVELHHVHARDVTTVMSRVEALGLSTYSTCGHTLRGVMSCASAGAGLDEPFDCYPDARAVSDAIMSRTPELNYRLPQRVNVLFGGCEDCRGHAKTNEMGFVSTVRDGELGYELWTGGSLGRSSPQLAFRAVDFLPREDVLAAANAVVDVFVRYGNFDRPNKARLKYLIRELGEEDFTAVLDDALETRRGQDWPDPAPVGATEPDPATELLSCAPDGGWSSAVRPQRTAGRALVTVTAPMGDLDSEDMRLLADLSEAHGDGQVRLTLNQNPMLQGVAIEDVPEIRRRLAAVDLYLQDADESRDTRVCTGGPVCSLATTPSTSVGAQLMESPAVARHSELRIHVSGCVNSCAQQQIADIGFSGSKVTIDGRGMLGYRVYVGGDPRREQLAETVGRVAESDVVAIAEAIIGVWEALRHRGESLPATVARVGPDAIKAQVSAVFDGRWEPGPEPREEPDGQAADGRPSRLRQLEVGADRGLPLVAA